MVLCEQKISYHVFRENLFLDIIISTVFNLNKLRISNSVSIYLVVV